MSPGDVYNAEAIEKSVEDMTIEASRQGFAFASVRPGADRNSQARTINLVFTAEEGQRTYIERINIRGNSKTRDYVVRREFDVAEGDAYNRALINRAERRLRNLNYFKTVKITNEPGSAPDRVVLNVDVEDMSTGEISLSGGYSTSDGALAEPLFRSWSPIYSAIGSRLDSISTASNNCRRTSSPIRPIRSAPASGWASPCARICPCKCATRSTGSRSCCRTS
jgi:outer membrane protein assembly factor BamA